MKSSPKKVNQPKSREADQIEKRRGTTDQITIKYDTTQNTIKLMLLRPPRQHAGFNKF